MKIYRNRHAEKHILDTYDKLLDLWNVDKKQKDISTAYGTTHVIMCGNEHNPPLVLFHGVGDDDPFAKLGGKETLLQLKMNAKFFPEVGHGINHEISEQVNLILPDYLLS